MILKGSITSFDALKSKHKFDEMSFTKLKAIYKQRTNNSFGELDYESFGLINENGEPTNAGALLSDESPIRHSRLFCTRWNGIDKVPRIIDATDDKEYSGGLVNLLISGTEFVENNSKKAWKKIGDGRIEMPDYPQRAVLEGIVNALIHRNYLEIGSEVHIDMFDDRIEIYSPGGMYDGSKVQERDIMRIPSRKRNPVLADIFHRLKYMDRRGSGFKKILNDYAIQVGYSDELKPVFYSDNDMFLLILKNLNYKKQAKKISKTTKTFENITKIEKFLIKNGPTKANEIAQAIELSPSRTRAILGKMKNVKHTEEQKGRKYWI